MKRHQNPRLLDFFRGAEEIAKAPRKIFYTLNGTFLGDILSLVEVCILFQTVAVGQNLMCLFFGWIPFHCSLFEGLELNVQGDKRGSKPMAIFEDSPLTSTSQPMSHSGHV